MLVTAALRAHCRYVIFGGLCLILATTLDWSWPNLKSFISGGVFVECVTKITGGGRLVGWRKAGGVRNQRQMKAYADEWELIHKFAYMVKHGDKQAAIEFLAEQDAPPKRQNAKRLAF